MQGPALPVLSPSRFLDKSLTPTRLFSGSLGEIRASPEPSSSVRRRRLPGGCWGHHRLETVLAQAPNGEESFGLGPEQAASLRKRPQGFGGLPRIREIDTKRN